MNRRANQYYRTSREHLQDEMNVLDSLLELAMLRLHLQKLETSKQSEHIRKPLSGINNHSTDQHEDNGAITSNDGSIAHQGEGTYAVLLDEIRILEEEIGEKTLRSKDKGIALHLETIAGSFTLSQSESFVLVICYAHRCHQKYEEAVHYLSKGNNQQFPSIALLHALVSLRYGEHPSFDASFSSTAPLIKNGLIEFVGEPNGARMPFWSQQVTISGTAYRYLNGGNAESDALEVLRDYPNRNLAKLATKISHTFTFDDIILPKDTKSQLREIVSFSQQQHRILYEWNFAAKLPYGRGLSVLFSGQSGTGKTMAAGIIANELKIDAYRIDLSTIVSKYIGETEKNLSAVFAEAKNSNAILVFDEADALFGKRSEVKDAHDRYANVEISYLLQKMEEYEGMTILTTNLRMNIDEAFTRRLKFIVEFPFPNEAHREAIWRISFPKEAPLDLHVDCAFLAKKFTEHAGGDIQLMAIMSAMFAGKMQEPIGMKHILLAVRRMYQRKGRTLREFDYKPYYDLIKDEIG